MKHILEGFSVDYRNRKQFAFTYGTNEYFNIAQFKYNRMYKIMFIPVYKAKQ